MVGQKNIKRVISSLLFPPCSEIMYHEGILLKNQRYIVSTILCSEMKSIMHEVHFRLENWKKWSYQAHFWPLINNMLTRYSSPYPLLASTKLTNQAPNEKSKIRNINFVMAPIPEENAQHSCLNCNRKNHFKVCCP